MISAYHTYDREDELYEMMRAMERYEYHASGQAARDLERFERFLNETRASGQISYNEDYDNEFDDEFDNEYDQFYEEEYEMYEDEEDEYEEEEEEEEISLGKRPAEEPLESEYVKYVCLDDGEEE
jgi:hypothetical protein